MIKLVHVLPELVMDMESALVHIGRGDLVAQLKEALLERWTYDDFSDTTYLYLSSSPAEEAFDVMQADRLSLYDELRVNLDSDDRGRLRGIEILEGRRVATRLENAAA